MDTVRPDVTYTVDAVGNRTAKVNQLSGGPTENYTYDAIYQLTQVAQAGPSTTESYTYDPVGNRLSSLGAATWSYNASNHLTSISGSPGTSFTYDANGNTLTKTDSSGTTTYAWDYENRLTSVTLPSTAVVSFKYDPLGRRIQKATSSATTIYAYDGANIVEETNASGTAQARFVMGLSIDEPLAQLRSSATHFYSADGLGSITSLTNGAGAVAASYTYDTFGNLASSSGSVVNPFRYTAREWDSETGLHFYRARYYSAESKRFMTEDPLQFVAGINFYAYVGNDPANLVDPSGMQRLDLSGFQQRVVRTTLAGVTFARDFTRGTLDMYRNYQDMKDANTVGADKYYHCMANCEAAKRGKGGYVASVIISELREDYGHWKGDPIGDTMEDMRANDCGRGGAPDCARVCSVYLPPGFNPAWRTQRNTKAPVGPSTQPAMRPRRTSP